MTRDRLIELAKQFFPEDEVIPRRKPGELEIRTTRERVVGVLTWLQNEADFDHLMYISAVDWIDEGEIELVYHVYSYDQRLYCMVKIRVDRDYPWAHTIHRLWAHAQVYEQEIHEFFGVYFPGNPDLSHLILPPEWTEAPPLRKDFDPLEYSMKLYEPEWFKSTDTFASIANRVRGEEAERIIRAVLNESARLHGDKPEDDGEGDA